MLHARESRMVAATTWVVLLGVACQAALGRGVKLTIYSQKVSTEAGKYSLLPPPASLTEGDAVPLYRKAAQMLPDRKSDEQVQQYLKMPLVLLRTDELEQLLKRYRASLKCVMQAVTCRDCKWPAEKPETVMPKLSEYRRLAYAVRLWARHEIAREDYAGAILALQTGFGMSRHLTRDSTMLEFVVGQGIATMMCSEVEEFVQADEAPNLYAALAALPKPFLDVEKAIEVENKAMASEPPAGLLRGLHEENVKLRAEAGNKIRTTSKRLDRDLAAWQCVEAIRAYTASHAGRLPQTLADIKEVSLPQDPITGAAFRYTQTSGVAVLESPAPAGGTQEKDALYLQITVKN
jgi:hypothetical protein